MKLSGPTLLAVLLCSFSAIPAFPSEIGFSFGTSLRSSDIGKPVNFLSQESYVDAGNYPGSSDDLLIITTGDDPDVIPFGHRVGSTYFDFIYVHELPREGFELEHNAYAMFGAQESVRKHGVGYAANLNYVTPWYPEIMLWRMKPFIGAGAGYAYIFGHNKEFDTGYSLNSGGEFQINLGGGFKIHVHRQWWMRLTVRDAIAPRMKKLDYYEELIPDNPDFTNNLYSSRTSFFQTRKSAHHIQVFFSLVKNTRAEEEFEY